MIADDRPLLVRRQPAQIPGDEIDGSRRCPGEAYLGRAQGERRGQIGVFAHGRRGAVDVPVDTARRLRLLDDTGFTAV